MRANETGVSSLFSVELCPDCPFRRETKSEITYINNSGASGTDLDTVIEFLPEDPNEDAQTVSVDGIRRTPDLIDAFDNCEGPTVIEHLIKPDEFICGALEAFKLMKKDSEERLNGG